MATYSTDLQTITLCDSGTFTEWTGYTSASSPALTTETYIHNGSAVDQATGQVLGQAISIAFDFGSNISWTAGWIFSVWSMYASPTAIDSWSNGGVRLAVGSGLGTFAMYNALGNNFGEYPYGGWQNTAIDPTLTADQTVGGGNGGNYRYFGQVANTLVKITKGSPHSMDAIRYGRGQIKATGTGANFTDMAAANDATTARWGLFSNKGGVFKWKGLMSLGDASNSVTFSDSNKTILLEDTPRVSSAFNRLEIRHASSSVTWNSVSISGVQTSITGSAPVSRGDLEVFDSAVLINDGCTFTDMGTFVYSSNCDLTGNTWRRCGQITLGAAALDGGLITNSYAAIALKCGSSIASLSNTDFVSTGTGHAIEITGGTSHTLDGITFTGYAASNGSTGNESVYVNIASGDVTIYADSTFSYRTAGANVTIVAGAKTVSVTVTDKTGAPINGAFVGLFAKDATGDLPYQDTVTISNSGTTATVTHTAHGMLTGDKVLIEGASLDANNGVWTITKLTDNSYSYTMLTAPGSSPTGTILATWAALYEATVTAGKVSMSRVFSTDQPVVGWARKSTYSPYYKTGAITGGGGKISSTVDTDFSALLLRDDE